jgi:glutamate-ammonia-ligase adenylyltransferase
VRLTKVSGNLENELVTLAAGAITPDDFNKLILLFESELQRVYFTKSSEANLIRMIRGMLDKVFFINECIKYPHYVEILVTIASNSNFLSDILSVNSEFFYWIVNPASLENPIVKKEFKKEIETSLLLYNSFNAKVHLLKSIKRRELLKIGLRDIYVSIPLKKITEELSVLASTLTSELFQLCVYETLKKYNITKTTANYCLISLGKLGGNELNYSSDVDLILFYDRERKIGNNKYFSELLKESTELFLNSSADIYGGLLYRIDFRLRPDGRNAPICRGTQEYLNYYESRGEDWERQMLIKAGYLSGSKSLYKKFMTYLTPFVYPSSLSTSPREQVLKMKAEIEKHNREIDNIKLLPGGIRDIEFAVQVLQMLNGGRIHAIRSGNTLAAIELLYANKLLDENERTTLTEAYIFYRKIEHYLQLMNDRQTHAIPEEGEMLEKLSFYLGFDSVDKFRQKIDLTTKKVRKIYNSILVEDESTAAVNDKFDKISFENKVRAEKDFQFLKDGRSITGDRTFDFKSIESFEKIENHIVEYLYNSSSPDKTLTNFVRIIKQSAFPSIWYNELLDKTFFKFLMNICEYSQYSIDLFAEDKNLRDFTLSRKVFMRIPKNELSKMDTRFILYYFSVQITVELIDPIKASRFLSELMIIKMKKLIENYSANTDWEKDYFVAALGSLGTLSLTFYSDFDIVFLTRNIKQHTFIEKRFQELLTKIKVELYPFTIDCRLRPEGKSSQLVWDINSASEYFRKRARIWEFQALTKIVFIAGNKRLFKSFTKSTVKSLYRFDKEVIKQELVEMRKKLALMHSKGAVEFFDFKKSAGSQNDIEFIIQFFLLRDPEIFDESFSKSLTENLMILKRGIKQPDKNLLKDAYNFYKRAEILNQLIFNSTTPKIDLAGEKIEQISDKIISLTKKDFKSLLKNYSSGVSSIYSKTFN